MERTGCRIWIGTAGAALVLSLAACGDDPNAPGSQSAQSSEDTPVQQEPAEDYAIDECLVGVWTTVSQREQTMVNGEEVVLIDVERQLTFSSDGMETVKYFDTPAQLQSPTGEPIGEVTQSGEHTFKVNTDDKGIINFEPTGGGVTDGNEAVFARAV